MHRGDDVQGDDDITEGDGGPAINIRLAPVASPRRPLRWPAGVVWPICSARSLRNGVQLLRDLLILPAILQRCIPLGALTNGSNLSGCSDRYDIPCAHKWFASGLDVAIPQPARRRGSASSIANCSTLLSDYLSQRALSSALSLSACLDGFYIS